MEEEKKQQTEYEEPVQEETAEEEKNHEGVLPIDETGVIAANTKVTGDIVTRGHLMIYGEVEGNVTAAGNITATGRI